MRFYVYELIDPRDGSVFYVGKGKGNRLEHHEKEARAGKRSAKCERIREIWDAGLVIERKIAKRFEAEEDAYAFEAGRIAEIGLAKLTNQKPGGAGQTSVDPFSSKAALRKLGAPLAKILRFKSRRERLILFGFDVTTEMDAILRKYIKGCGIEALAEAVRPHGVIIEGINASGQTKCV